MARTALDESLTLGREQAQSYEVSLTLVALSRLQGWVGGGVHADAEAVVILDGLGDVVPEVVLALPRDENESYRD